MRLLPELAFSSEHDATIRRYLMDEIDWRDRLICIMGPRGVGRETYFLNQLRHGHTLAYTGVGDFVVDGRWTFEIGGKGKGFSQIADVKDSFVVNDDVSVGQGNKIPLWLFGLMY